MMDGVMDTQRDPRANNARKHGLTTVGDREPAAAEMAVTMAGAGAAPAHARSAEWLVDSFSEGRRIAQAKADLVDRATEAAAPAAAGLYAYTDVLAELIRLERYERRAESRFLSASRAYAKAEGTTVVTVADSSVDS
jgi:hypothetical protein